MEKYYLFDVETEQIVTDEDGEAIWAKNTELLRGMLVTEGYSEDAILTKFAALQMHSL